METLSIFLVFWPGFQFFVTFMVIFKTDYIGKTILKTRLVFIKCEKKYWNQLREPEVRGHNRVYKWFQIFLISHLIKPLWFQDFLPKYSWNHNKDKKNNAINSQRNKKRRFLLKTPMHAWIPFLHNWAYNLTQILIKQEI